MEHTRGSGGGGGGGGGRRDFGDRDRGGFGGRRVSFDWLCVMSVFLHQLHFSHLVPGPDTAWWLKTSHPLPRGRFPNFDSIRTFFVFFLDLNDIEENFFVGPEGFHAPGRRSQLHKHSSGATSA